MLLKIGLLNILFDLQMMFTHSLTWMCWISPFLLIVHGFPTNRDKIPNGYNVPNPCFPATIWNGVGHHEKLGGGTLNPFGTDFLNNGQVRVPHLMFSLLLSVYGFPEYRDRIPVFQTDTMFRIHVFHQLGHEEMKICFSNQLCLYDPGCKPPNVLLCIIW